MMKVLIVENEMYLAQSIANKLAEANYHCDIISNLNQFDKAARYEVILLSSAVAGFESVIEGAKNSVIILLVSYVSFDTVLSPIKLGASDYIQKPFMVEELLRKIKHELDFKALQSLNNAYTTYIESTLQKINLTHSTHKKIKLPIILQSLEQINADAFVFHYLKAHRLHFHCLDLSLEKNLEKKLKGLESKDLCYLLNYHLLESSQREKLFELVRHKNVMIHSGANLNEYNEFEMLDLNSDEKSFQNNEILTIDEYVRFVITNHQDELADTELALKLGISRKSLWEKRKKYALTKKK